MATKAPDVVARCVSSSFKTPPHNGRAENLRVLFISEDADAIWNEIYAFIQSAKPLSCNDHETIAQDLFLQLLSLQKFEKFFTKDYSDEEICRDLLSHLQESLQSNC
jgi:hypothetical protein